MRGRARPPRSASYTSWASSKSSGPRHGLGYMRAIMPGGIAMPREARTSLAWYSRSFKRLWRGGVEWTGRAGCLGVVLPTVAEAPLEAGVAHEDDAADHEKQDDHQAKAASDQNRGQRDASPAGLSLHADRPPDAAVPVLKPVVGNPTSLGLLAGHGVRVLAKQEAPVVAAHPCLDR